MSVLEQTPTEYSFGHEHWGGAWQPSTTLVLGAQTDPTSAQRQTASSPSERPALLLAAFNLGMAFGQMDGKKSLYFSLCIPPPGMTRLTFRHRSSSTVNVRLKLIFHDAVGGAAGPLLDCSHACSISEHPRSYYALASTHYFSFQGLLPLHCIRCCVSFPGREKVICSPLELDYSGEARSLLSAMLLPTAAPLIALKETFMQPLLFLLFSWLCTVCSTYDHFSAYMP